MSFGGFGSLPSFARDDGAELSPTMRSFLQGIGTGAAAPSDGIAPTPFAGAATGLHNPSAGHVGIGLISALGQPQDPTGFGQDVPAATPPGFLGFTPPTPPTGTPTPVMQPGAAAFGSGLASALGPSGAQAATFSPPGQGMGQGGGYADRVFGAESGGDNFAKNARSSATGAGQFIDSTWLDQVRKNRSDLAGLPDGQILAMRSDPVLSRQMTEAYGNENGARLQAAGLPVNDGTKYLAHFAGPQGAVAVLSADPSTPVSRVLQPGQISANPHIANMTAGQVAAWAAGQVGGNRGGGASSLGSMMPGMSAPGGASMGSTAQRGGFGIGGVVGQGAAVPGQSSPVPGVASLSGQPLTVDGAPAQQQPAPASTYGNLASLLKGAQAAQKGQQSGPAMPAIETPGGKPLTLQQARAMFDPGKFYSMLRSRGVGA